MSPQDPQTPLNDPNATPPPQPGADLNAQIPPSYAPNVGGDTPATGGSALQDALNAQLGGSAANVPTDVPLTPTSSAPAPDAIDAHLAADEPDPMAGFAAPSPSPNAVPTPKANPVAVDNAVVPPAAPEPAVVDTANSVAATPAPTATQPYDPSQDAGAGAPASSYPAAPEPLPPNPLEMDETTPPPAPFAPEAPIPAAPEPVAPVASPVEPAPVEVAPQTEAQPAIDPVSGAPIQAGTGVAPTTTDSTLQSMLEDPQPTSEGVSNEVDPYSDPALEAAAASASGGGKGILMSVGIGAGVLIFGIIVLALILGKKPTTEVPADSLTSEQSSSSSNNANTAPITVPDGYVAINKDCYQFGLPQDNTVSVDDTSCKVDATFGSQGVSVITVLPTITSYDSLDKAVAAAKETYKYTSDNIVSERKISLGGIDAQEIVHNAGTADAPNNQTMIIVLLKGKNYQLDGQKVTTFEINMSSNDSFSQDAVSTLESTWSWK